MIRKLYTIILLAMLLQSCVASVEQHTPAMPALTTEEVLQAVEDFRLVLLQPQEERLRTITDETLSYGHSSGMCEDQTTFMQSLLTKKFTFTELAFTHAVVRISGETAVVRHELTGQSLDRGKAPATVRLHVMLVWQKKDNQLRLLARQAVKI